jgi:hypothetical protein
VAIALLAMGSGGDEATSNAPPPVRDEQRAVRATLQAYFEANSTGDYDQVCSLFTPEEQQHAAARHDPGTGAGCVQAFKAEAKLLGDSLADANEIYASAQIDSVTTANDAATAVILLWRRQRARYRTAAQVR